MAVGWKNVSHKTRTDQLPHYSLLSPLSADWDMVFADDEKEANPASFKFFQAAQEWSRNRGNLGLDDDDDDDDSSDDDDE
jgi:hypothetical protein